MFELLQDQPAARQYLERAIETLPHALLFWGGDPAVRTKGALVLASHLLQTPIARLESGLCPDLFIIAPEGKAGLHSIDSFRASIHRSHEAPFEGIARVFVIEAAERMQSAAAHALLKTLEEPPPGTYWILSAPSPHEILPTIASRCAKVPFRFVASRELRTAEWEQARKRLFAAFENRPAYPQLVSVLEAVEKELDDEDSLRKTGQVHALFSALAEGFRDSELRVLDPYSPHLFFPEAHLTPPPHWQERLEKAQLGVERNLRLSHCLELLFIENSGH